MKRKLCQVIVCLLLLPTGVHATENAESFAFYPQSFVDKLATQNHGQEKYSILRFADKVLNDEPHALTTLHTEGTLPHQGIRDESAKAQRDLDAMLQLALAYRISGNDKYLQQLEKFFQSWTNTYKWSFNPIDEANFDKMILAFDLTKSVLSSDIKNSLNLFLKNLAQGYTTTIFDPKRKAKFNNWQSYRVKLATLASYSSNDQNLIALSHKGFSQQIENNINQDGSVVDFAERDALHYVTYDLEPLLIACIAAKFHGEDWYHEQNSKGVSVSSAVKWMIPYAQGKITHEEFVHSQVAFDAKRAQAGVKGFSGMYDPANSSYFLSLASVLDPTLQDVSSNIVAKNNADAWVKIMFVRE